MTRAAPYPFETMSDFIDEVCSAAGSRVLRKRGSEAVLTPCPLSACKGDKFAINMDSGVWNCPKCGEKGNAWQLCKILRLEPVAAVRAPPPAANRCPQDTLNNTHREGEDALDFEAGVMRFLETRWIRPETAKNFRIAARVMRGGCYIGFPFLRANGDTAFIKWRNISEKDKQFRLPAKSEMPLPEETPLFGKLDPHVPPILVEGELDAMTLWQVGLRNVASLTNGAGSWDEDWSRQLLHHKVILCAYDADTAGEAAAEKMRARFGREVVRRVYFGPYKDANAALMGGWTSDQFIAAVEHAEIKPPEIIRSVREIAGELIGELERGELPKPLMTGHSEFDATQRGLREGEFSVVTAHTGEGKTTFWLDLCLRMSERGDPVCFLSMEQPVAWTVRQVIAMVANCAFEDLMPDEARQAHARLPERFYIGAEPEKDKVRQVVAALKFCRAVYDVRLAVVDHLDFLIEVTPDQTRYNAACDAVKKMHAVARDFGMHVVLVCQPTTDSGRSRTAKRPKLKLEDIAETRLARQIAHNGFVFSADKQRREGSLYVAKARYGPAREDITIDFRFDGFRFHETGGLRV